MQEEERLYEQFLQFSLFLQIEFLQHRHLQEKVNIPARHHQMTQDLQAWNRLLESPLMSLRRVNDLKEVFRNQREQLQQC